MARKLVVCCDGTWNTPRNETNVFHTYRFLRERLGSLADLAADGLCVAAKDISMAGLVGSLAMLLEHGRLGVTVDLAAVPTPAGVPLTRWLNCFPSFGFLLCVPAGREDECLAAFAARDLAAAVVGTLDGGGELVLARGDERATVLHLADFRVTGLPR